MPLDILRVVGQVAGIGGIAIGALLIVFREVIRKRIFPDLSPEHGFRLLRLMVVLVFVVALAGITAWVLVQARPAQPVTKSTSSLVVSPTVFQAALVNTPRRNKSDNSRLVISARGGPITDAKLDILSLLVVSARIDGGNGERSYLYRIPVDGFWPGREETGYATDTLFELSHYAGAKSTAQLTYRFRDLAQANDAGANQGADIAVETLVTITYQDATRDQHVSFVLVREWGAPTTLSAAAADSLSRAAKLELAVEYGDIDDRYLAGLWRRVVADSKRS